MSADASAKYRVHRPGRLWEAVVAPLVERVVSGEFPPGSTLPTEPKLAAEFGVSRTVVREALKIVEEKGLIEIQHGRGTVVQEPRHWNLLDAAVLSASLDHDPASTLFEDLTAMRIAIESEVAARAAGRITDEELAEMEALIARMRTVVNQPDDYLELDLAFHKLILQAAGNRLASAIMDAIEEPLRSSRRITNRWPDGIESGQKFHERIFGCLRQRDARAAEQAMRDHLEWARKRWKSVRRPPEPRRRPT